MQMAGVLMDEHNFALLIAFTGHKVLNTIKSHKMFHMR